MALFRFYCDESYDSDPHQDKERVLSAAKNPYIPKTFIVGGFFSDEIVWKRIKRSWDLKNRRAGVSRFHATYLNARDGEYQGWGKNRQIRYAKDMAAISTPSVAESLCASTRMSSPNGDANVSAIPISRALRPALR